MSLSPPKQPEPASPEFSEDNWAHQALLQLDIVAGTLAWSAASQPDVPRHYREARAFARVRELLAAERARLHVPRLPRANSAEPAPACGCHKCQPVTLLSYMRMVLCPECGNKRCPKAQWHEHSCTGSNEPGQLGSAYGPALCTGCASPAACTKAQCCQAEPSTESSGP